MAYRSTFLLLAIAIMFLVKFSEKITVLWRGYSGAVELLILVLLAVFSIQRIKFVPREINIFFLIVVVSLLFGMYYRIDQHTISQFAIDVKFPLAMVATYGFISNRLFLSKIPYFLMFISCIGILFIVMEWIIPGVYLSVFPYTTIDSYITGTNIRRSAGLFIHPGPLGIFSAICLLYFYVLSRYKGWLWHIRVGAIASLIGLLASGQRAELLAIIIAISALITLERWHKPIPMILLIVSMLAFGWVLEQHLGSFLDFLTSSAYGDISNDAAPRAVLLRGAVDLAHMNFPVGTGLGTYGSSMSLSNPNNAYQLSGLMNVWWFEGSNFLTDTYWAMPLAEQGWIGAGLLLMAYLYLLWVSVVNVLSARYKMELFSARLSFLVLLFLLIDSFGAPVYTGSGLVIILAGAIFSFCVYNKQLANKLWKNRMV